MTTVPPPRKPGEWTEVVRTSAIAEGLGGAIVGFVLLAKLIGVL